MLSRSLTVYRSAAGLAAPHFSVVRPREIVNSWCSFIFAVFDSRFASDGPWGWAYLVRFTTGNITLYCPITVAPDVFLSIFLL